MSPYSCSSALRRTISSAQLTANVQTVAGIISLLNDFLISHNRPPLGFLNPWLYGIGIGGLKDIISGSNPGCDTPGFPAVPGWDPVRPLVPLHFQSWLILSSVGDGSGDTELFRDAEELELASAISRGVTCHAPSSQFSCFLIEDGCVHFGTFTTMYGPQ